MLLWMLVTEGGNPRGESQKPAEPNTDEKDRQELLDLLEGLSAKALSLRERVLKGGAVKYTSYRDIVIEAAEAGEAVRRRTSRHIVLNPVYRRYDDGLAAYESFIRERERADLEKRREEEEARKAASGAVQPATPVS